MAMAALRSDPPATTAEDGGWLRLVIPVLAVWLVVALVWASRPVTDAVPLAPKPAPEAGVTDNLEVHCNSILSSSARDDAPLPTPPEGYSLARTPCESQHTEGRVLLGINALIAVVGSGWAFVVLRGRRQAAQS